RTSIDPGPNEFEVYDPDTDVWTSLGTVSTGANLAVSGPNLYALNDATNMIQRYDRDANTWADVHTGPPASVGYGNLEVTSAGEFFVSQSGDSGLFYTTGATWHVFTLPGPASAIGDYDPGTNVLAIGQYSSEAVWTINPQTLDITPFSVGAGGTGETRR